LIFERKGIRTDLFAIEAYVEEVLEEVLSNHYCIIITLFLEDRNRFLTNINTPLSKKALEVLN